MSDCRLYLITPSVIPDLAAFTRVVEEALSAGDVAALQIRMKEAPEHEIEAVTEAQPEPEKAPEPEAPRKPASKRRGRASVPSWDEIMFGGPSK